MPTPQQREILKRLKELEDERAGCIRQLRKEGGAALADAFENRTPDARILDNAADGIFTVTGTGLITYINQSGIRMLEADPNEVLGKQLVQLLGSRSNKKWLLQIARWLQSPEEESPFLLMTLPFSRPSGSKRWLNIHLQRRQAEEGSGWVIQGIARDITEQHRLEQALRRSEEHYRGIIENMHLGILEVDEKERIVRAFPKFCEIVGYTEEEMLGKKASDLFNHPEDRKHMDARTQERNAGKSGLYECPILNKEGETVWLLISGVPLYGEHGEVVGSMGIHYDISERKRDEFRLEKATADAEAAQISERQFLANMSHEIRTPLNAILGMSRLLKEGQLGIQEREFVEGIERGGSLLKGLLDDVLDLARLEEGRFELNFQPVRIRDTFDSAMGIYRVMMAEKGIRFSLDWDPKLDVHLSLDKGVVSQILLNLIGNATKFTEQGEVSLHAQHVREGNQEFMQVEVRDTGMGIPESGLAEIFARFRQLPSSRTGAHGGSGLGLAIVKKLCEAHGGSVEVESELDKGSTFRFRLRTETVTDVREEAVRVSPEALAFQHILVAEDNEVNILYLGRLLKKWKLPFSVVRNGKEALKFLEENEVDLILMDVQMPEMDGIEATRRIRQWSGPKGKLPIVGLSAFAFYKDVQEGMEAGMTQYLKKPFSLEDLLKVLLRVMDS